MSLLAIDFGLSRIGVAYSEGELARPLTTIVAKTKKERLNKVLSLLSQYNVDTIIIGTTSGTLKPAIDQFVKQLKKQFPGTITLVDEGMSTREATDILIDLNVAAKKRRNTIDQFAATLILERYLNEQEEK